ncbi:hypothetical protein [Streptomyces sp. NPDC000410]|uniref:hypothetical protein n=1 Tax=Streptomyces sp. NPDC000410 TaxID=3154254 RepID=UPI003317464B
MGSLRNPVGPLPSSIYWRRRAIALSLLALLAVVAVWMLLTSGGGGGVGKAGDDAKAGEAPPTDVITPGPDPSGPAISERPGGRDESEDPGDSDGAGGGGQVGGTSTGADAGGNEGGKNGDPGASGAVNGGGGSAGQRVPAGSLLPNCTPGALQLALRSIGDPYGPGERPRFQLAAKNTSSVTCKADFGPKAAVLTISDSAGKAVWSSSDCPRDGGSLLLRVPAGATITHTVDWDRSRSAPQCATPAPTQLPPGRYRVATTFPGTTVPPESFSLQRA